MPPPFECAEPEAWRLDGVVPKERRRRLLSPPSFEGIVARLRHRLTIEQVRCQRAKSRDKAFRVFVKLRTSAQAIDLFHNSACGYRAQYYASVKAGEAANALVLTELLPVVVPLLLEQRPSFPGVVLEQSLRHPWAKVWVHQGLWLRYARREHQVLHVPGWQSQLASADARARKLARWGCLAPECESAFVIKGGFVFSNGRHRLDVPPKNRAEEIHACGFT